MPKPFLPLTILALVTVLLGGASAGAAWSQESTTASAKPLSAGDSSAADSAVGSRNSAQKLEDMLIAARRARARYAPGYTRTATKTPALPRDVPQSLVTVSRELVRDQGMQGIADVVRYVPGMTAGQGEGNRDQATIRGNSSTADFFVDGVRDDAQYFRDLYNLERIEALKGSNAMVFGRGGGGGVLNRVTKEAQWETRHDVTAEGGSYGKRRISADLHQSVSRMLAARLNTVYERSDMFRDGASLERSGINPAITIVSQSLKTRINAGYEYFRDHRTADRGIPSFEGRPVATSPSTFFGNPDESYSKAIVNSATATLSHDAGRVQIRNNARVASYDKVYQNVYPGAVDAAGANVSVSAYRQATDRYNLFNQTDVTWTGFTGDVTHDFLAGVELGRQATDNFRSTGYFNGTATSVLVPVGRPFASSPVTFRQSSSDADNETIAGTRSLYVQDQVTISPQLRVVGGARYEQFDVRYRDHRSATRLTRTDGMVSPRFGLIFKPAELVSIYASYSRSYLPGSGDQFSSLSEVTSALRPERFANYEAGAKWDVLDRLGISAAVYRLDRTNTRAVDPAAPTKFVQTGAQRSQGFELSATGNVTPAWELAAGIARQNAVITSATTASAAGASVPLVPRTSLSLWNRYAVTGRFGVALGAVHQSGVFAAIDNKVTLPAFNRFDAALFAGIAHGIMAQVNVENLLNARYYPTAHSNNNILPGSPRAARASLTASF